MTDAIDEPNNIWKYITPILDRTIEDVRTKTPKAFWNVADWFRLYNNSKLAARFVAEVYDYSFPYIYNEIDNENGIFIEYAAPTIETITALVGTEYFITDQFNLQEPRAIMANQDVPILALRYWYLNPNYLDVNNAEQVLSDMFSVTVRAKDNQVYCGVGRIGQPRWYQHRHRYFPGWAPPSLAPYRHFRCGTAYCGASILRGNGFRRYD